MFSSVIEQRLRQAAQQLRSCRPPPWQTGHPLPCWSMASEWLVSACLGSAVTTTCPSGQRSGLGAGSTARPAGCGGTPWSRVQEGPAHLARPHPLGHRPPLPLGIGGLGRPEAVVPGLAGSETHYSRGAAGPAACPQTNPAHQPFTCLVLIGTTRWSTAVSRSTFWRSSSWPSASACSSTAMAASTAPSRVTTVRLR